MEEDDIVVSLPMSELLRLIYGTRQIPVLADRIESLSARMDGLSNIYLQILDELKALKRNLK